MVKYYTQDVIDNHKIGMMMVNVLYLIDFFFVMSHA